MARERRQMSEHPPRAFLWGHDRRCNREGGGCTCGLHDRLAAWAKGETPTQAVLPLEE